jgi:hypothetical protein
VLIIRIFAERTRHRGGRRHISHVHARTHLCTRSPAAAGTQCPTRGGGLPGGRLPRIHRSDKRLPVIPSTCHLSRSPQTQGFKLSFTI